jgi:ribosomal protein S18 acetylase RimI-like enzyme
LTVQIEYRIHPELTSEDLNALFENVWDDHVPADLTNVLSHSLTNICAYRADKLIGYVNVAWDGGMHAFLLDTAVHREFRRQGIGTKLVEHAIAEVRARGLKWLHVDFEPHLEGFYRRCGFRFTAAGLIDLQ